MPRVVALATHPIQYHAPWFRALASESGIELEVLFGAHPEPEAQGVGFAVPFVWDLPLTEGYRSSVLERVPGSQLRLDRFFGVPGKGVARRLSDLAPDVLLSTGWNSGFLVRPLAFAARSRVPVVVRGESNALRRRPLPVRVAHQLLLRRYDAFLAIGRENRRFYREAGIAPGRIFDCPYFVDNDRFVRQASDLRPERAALRASWGISPAATCFLFAGKLMAKKRPLDLLRALASASRAGARAHLLVAGSGELLEPLATEAAAGGLPVTFAGFLNQTEISRAYVAADCLVLPSDSGETWGLVVNEAMASGLPAIVSDRVGCGVDLVEEGRTGWRYPCGDVSALADRLGDAASAGERLAALGEAARQRVVEGFTVRRAVTATLAAISSVLDRR